MSGHFPARRSVYQRAKQPGGPLGVLAGGIIGGVVGGMAGSWAGSTFSDIANAGISHLFHWGASS